jgi:hypothetical protein
MKICPKCNINKVKNSYQQCYLCNLNDDTVSEPDNEKEIKREQIPKCVRNALWINYFQNQREGKCQCCLRETISIGNFHAGHIKAHINGGSISLDNLVPICMLCNLSMTKHDLKEFIAKYNLHYGIDKL